MVRTRLFRHVISPMMALLMTGVIACAAFGREAQTATGAGGGGLHPHLLLPDNRIVIGMVQRVNSGVAQVNVGELQPLLLSLEDARARGITSLRTGAKLEIVLTNNDLPIDYHLVGQPGWDRVLEGRLLQPFAVLEGQLLQPFAGDQRWAVIHAVQGTNQTYEVALRADRTLLNMPVGVPALFLLDKHDLIIDATFKTEKELVETLEDWVSSRNAMSPH